MRILFQGDSITDGERDRNDQYHLGYSYPLYAADYLRQLCPDTEFEFINRGIGGNYTHDLLARLDSDVLKIQPDILSILIGVNDVWARRASDFAGKGR